LKSVIEGHHVWFQLRNAVEIKFHRDYLIQYSCAYFCMFATLSALTLWWWFYVLFLNFINFPLS